MLSSVSAFSDSRVPPMARSASRQRGAPRGIYRGRARASRAPATRRGRACSLRPTRWTVGRFPRPPLQLACADTRKRAHGAAAGTRADARRRGILLREHRPREPSGALAAALERRADASVANAAALADELEKERGLERITWLPPTVWARGGGIAAGGGGGGGAARGGARGSPKPGRGRGRAGAPGRRRGPRSRRADASDGAAEPRLLAAAAD